MVARVVAVMVTVMVAVLVVRAIARPKPHRFTYVWGSCKINHSLQSGYIVVQLCHEKNTLSQMMWLA
jgi:hypothetical protein